MKLWLLGAVMTCAAMTSFWSASSLYRWNDTKRPPVSLEAALAKAQTLLGDDARNRYCVAVVLYGDETGSGKEGAWNLYFAATDGSKKHVFVNMQGESEVGDWNGPVNVRPKGERLRDLSDVRRRLAEVFAQLGLEARVSEKDNELLIEHRTRAFQIYPEGERGSYGDELRATRGPLPDGLWIQVKAAEHPDLRVHTFRGPYWTQDRRTYFSSRAGKYFVVETRYGNKVTHETLMALMRALGEQTPEGWGGP